MAEQLPDRVQANPSLIHSGYDWWPRPHGSDLARRDSDHFNPARVSFVGSLSAGRAVWTRALQPTRGS